MAVFDRMVMNVAHVTSVIGVIPSIDVKRPFDPRAPHGFT
jgi:hypothetical protein